MFSQPSHSETNLLHVRMSQRLARTYVSLENVTELLHDVGVLQHFHILHNTNVSFTFIP